MHHTRQAIARTIAEPLIATERAIDEALAQASMMAAAMANGRKEAKVPAMLGQEVFESLGSAMQALFEARRQIVAAHVGLDETRQHLRLPAVSYGDEAPKPDRPIRSLTVVQNQAA
ncbi:MAG: hypothetical protein EON55_27970 [Alphaproteobacteria bacterium]|jgi:hypothetical protein|nr:MAG: hypothetical protein EON55_27970 [Alphaproteobacteria bacterium]